MGSLIKAAETSGASWAVERCLQNLRKPQRNRSLGITVRETQDNIKTSIT